MFRSPDRRLFNPFYKTDLFESFVKMMELNLIEFTEEYLNKGYVNLIYEIDSKGQRTQRYTYPSEEEEKELKRNGITVECRPVKLDPDEEIALKQIDLMKNEFYILEFVEKMYICILK